MSIVTQGSFTIERRYPYPPARVFRAWSDPASKAAWFRGPEEWDRGVHTVEFREGGKERVEGGPPGAPVHICDATYQDIAPNRHIVYTYVMYFGEARLSVSLASVEFHAEGKGTRLVLTEHVVYFLEADGIEGREQGTRQLLEQLGKHLDREAEHEMITTRMVDLPPAAVFAAWADPARLVRWWGPAGFRSTSHAFDFREGGRWHLTMHAPDGGSWENHWIFQEIVPAARVVALHDHPTHRFTLTATFDAEGAGTRVSWIQRFEDPAEARNLRAILSGANEQNLDRLEAELRRG